MKTKLHLNESGNSEGTGCLLCMLFLFFIVVPLLNTGYNSSKTDGVFESATKKIDSGRADQLTREEAQRIDDIMNWCKVCNKPLRKCPHGK